MANEFKVKNGLYVSGSATIVNDANISGSLTVSNGITGNVTGTASFATTASYALNAGAGAGFPYSGSAVITGSLYVSGSGITGSLSGSLIGTASYATQALSSSFATYAISASNAPGFTVQYAQTTPASTWSFTHNLNTRNPIVQVYDSTYKQIIPNDIVATSGLTAEIRFDYSESGYVVFSNGGGLYITGSTSQLNQDIAAVTWSFTHNLNSKYVNFEVYDSNDLVIIPAGIRAMNSNQAELYFSTAQTGIAVANFSGISGSTNAVTASYALTATSSSYATVATTATTASFANAFTVAGTLTAQTLVVQTITSSVDFVTGSTRFGTIIGNTHQFTGSVGISGSTTLVGSLSGTSATFSGNVGIGVTPSAWAGRVAMQISPKLALWGDVNQSIISHNIYTDPSDKYIANGAASIYTQSNGSHIWLNAPSGTAGNAISFTQAMTLTAAGRLLLGTTTEGSYKLDVNGTGRFVNDIEIGTTGGIGINVIPIINTSFPSSSVKATIGVTNSGFGYSAGSLFLQPRTGVGADLVLGTEGTAKLTIASTGAATFSSSVAVGTNLTVGTASGGVSAPTNILMDGTYRTGSAVFDALKLYLYKSSTETYGLGLGDTGDLQYWAGTTSTGVHRWFTSQTERMRITSGGNVLIGTTSTALLGIGTFSYNTNDTSNPTILSRNGGGSAAFMSFSDSGATTTLYGWIVRSGSGVNYASASDYRLKENIQPIENALLRVSKLKPVSYNWKLNGSKDEGFIAHELQELLPQAVTGEKDGKQMQGVDYSKIVPILVKAVQEQNQLIQELQSQINEIKAQ